MRTDRHSARETKVAMFWTALAAQCAGEPYVTAKRIVASLLRTRSVATFCSRAQLDAARLYAAVEDPETLTFVECQRIVRSELAEQGLVFASKEHQAGVQLRPLEPHLRIVFDPILERHGQLVIAPLELLLEVIRADAALAGRLAAHGLDAAALEER